MLRLSKTDFDSVRSHAERDYPNECCGVLLGTLSGGVRVVRQVVPVANASEQCLTSRYVIAPEKLIEIQKQARETKLDIIGFYHSHPDHSASWSETDLREAHWLACSYVIVEVTSAGAGDPRSYALAGTSEEDKRFDDEQIEVTDSTAASLS